MKRYGKKVLSIAMCLLMAIVGMVGSVGCNSEKRGGEAVDKTKTQLYIATYGGGYGTAFLQDIEDRFEKWAMDNQKSYEDGKVGVQIYKTASKSKYTANALIDTIESDNYELYFVTGDSLNEFTDANGNSTKLRDISTIVKADNPFDNNTKSIEDKLRSEMKNHHNVGTAANSKYYSLPFVDGGTGLTYDKDVFRVKKLYFEKGGCPSEFCDFVQNNNANPATGEFEDYYFIANANSEKSAGPDGLYGTEDDGLPATLAEFQRLLTEMKEASVASLIWSGEYETEYSPFLARAFANNHHGLEESMIPYDAGGENGRATTIITGFDNQGNPQIKENHLIDIDNIADVVKQEGFYYGLKMFEMILKSGTVAEDAWKSLSHTMTQYVYVSSYPDQKIKDIAFLLDGTWWENEADSANSFNDYGPNFYRNKRNFGYFPMPWADESYIGNKYTMAGGGGSFFVSSRVSDKKAELIKDFIQFAFSDESLQRMTINIGVPSPYIYEMDGIPDASEPTVTYADKMSSYTRSFYNLYKNSNIVYPFVERELFTRVKTVGETITYMSSLDAENKSYTTFPSAWKKNGVTAEQFFTGLYRKATSK